MQNDMTHIWALKFLNILDYHGHFRFSKEQSLNASVRFFEKSKYCTKIIMFQEKLAV